MAHRIKSYTVSVGEGIEHPENTFWNINYEFSTSEYLFWFLALYIEIPFRIIFFFFEYLSQSCIFNVF